MQSHGDDLSSSPPPSHPSPQDFLRESESQLEARLTQLFLDQIQTGSIPFKGYKDQRRVPQLDLSSFSHVDSDTLLGISQRAYRAAKAQAKDGGRNSIEMRDLLYKLGDQVSALIAQRRLALRAAAPESVSS